MSKKPVDPGVCFVCQRLLTRVKGAADEATKEHYIPQWLFERHNLREQTMDLPSETQIAYTSLYVPCCAACNSRLNEEVEKRARELITSVPPPWAEEDRDVIKRWLTKVYLGVRVRASTLPADRTDPASPMIASQEEIVNGEVARLIIQGVLPSPHSSLFVYECDPAAGGGFDFYSSEHFPLIAIRSGSVGLIGLLFDGEYVENDVLPDHPLVAAGTQGALNETVFLAQIGYAMGSGMRANVKVQRIYESADCDGDCRLLGVHFQPDLRDVSREDVMALAKAMAEKRGAELVWVEGRPQP